MSDSVGFCAGACTVEITPPVGTPMAGYGDRTGVSTGVHDPLFASALVLDDGGTTVALVSLDWIGVDAGLTASVRALASEATGIPAEHILIACSHTHSGPLLRSRYGGDYHDADLTAVTARKIAGAITTAATRRAAARWGVGAGRAPAIGTNRRDQKGATDDAVGVLRIDGPNGLLAATYTFACHPTVLDHGNMEISADFVGGARGALRSLYGDAPSFLYFNGASADISTRHLRRESSFAEATRFGRILAGEVIRLCESVQTTATGGPLRVARKVVQMPMRQLPDEPAAQAAVAAAEAEVARLEATSLPQGRGLLRTAEVNRMGAVATLGLVRRGALPPIQAEFQVIALGDVAWFCVPGELFTEIGMAVKALAPERHLHVVTHANDSIGYILTAEAHREGGYEAGTARLGPEAEQVVLSVAQELLSQVGFQEVTQP